MEIRAGVMKSIPPPLFFLVGFKSEVKKQILDFKLSTSVFSMLRRGILSLARRLPVSHLSLVFV